MSAFFLLPSPSLPPSSARSSCSRGLVSRRMSAAQPAHCFVPPNNQQYMCDQHGVCIGIGPIGHHKEAHHHFSRPLALVCINANDYPVLQADEEEGHLCGNSSW